MKTALFLKGSAVAVVLAALMAGGCSSSVVQVTATPDICRKSVEVHLVGVSRFEKEQWEQASMSSYWTPGNPLRKSARDYTYVIRFGRDPNCKEIIRSDSPVRKMWRARNAEYMFILADLPGIFPDMPGNADSRRLRLPVPESKCWGMDQSEINISIESGNIVPLTIPTSKKCD